MVLNVINAAVLPARGRPILVLIFHMESGPDPAARFAIAQQLDLFRIDLGMTQRIDPVDKLSKPSAVDENREETFTLRSVNVRQDPRCDVGSKIGPQCRLFITESAACLFGLRSSGCHLRIG